VFLPYPPSYVGGYSVIKGPPRFFNFPRKIAEFGAYVFPDASSIHGDNLKQSNEYDDKTNDSHDNRNYNWSFRICERRNFGLVADQSQQQYGSLQP